MKVKFEAFRRLYVLLLLSVLLWSVWTMAQDRPAAGATPPAAPAAADGAGARTGAHLTFGLDHIPYLAQHSFKGVTYWQWLAVVIYFAIAVTIAKLTDYLMHLRLRRLAGATDGKVDDVLLDLGGGPTQVIAFAILFYFGLRQYEWPAWFETAFLKAVTVVIGVSVTYVLLRLVDLLVAHWRAKAAQDADRAFDEQLFPILRKSIKIFILIAAALVIAQNLDIQVSGLIASLSIGGLAFGLAAQDTVANLFGAVAVFVDKPFRIGDRIQLATYDGTVETIGLRSTRIRSLDGYLITVPNKTMGNSPITNISRRPNIKTELNIGLVQSTPAAQVRRAVVLEEVYKSHPKTADLIISFNKITESTLNVLVIHWWNGVDNREHLLGMQELNLQIKERFDAEEIEFAFPTQTLHVKAGDIPLLPSPPSAGGV